MNIESLVIIPTYNEIENIEMMTTTMHDVLNYETEDVARAMTTWDLSHLAAVEPIQFLLTVWGTTGPTVYKLDQIIDHFNTVGFWVPTQICTQPDIKTRVKLIEKFIKIAKVSLKHQHTTSIVSF
jgi:hypothetical protein